MKVEIVFFLTFFNIEHLEAALSKRIEGRPKLLINGRPAGGLVPKHKFKTSNVNKGPSSDQYITQPVDHLDFTNTNTFQQRYWYNNQWYVPDTNNCVFLMIEGDAPADNSGVSEGLLMTQLADIWGCFVFSLEHRYYGASNVTKDLSTDNLRFLTSQQALGDIANFIQTMNVKFNLSAPYGGWVTFGGSYAGALAAWAIQQYPTLVIASIVSSGMVQAVVDNAGYLQVVEQVLKSSTPDCGLPLRDGLLQIRELMMTANGRQKLFKGFQLCEPLDNKNSEQIAYFYSRILDPYMFGVTYGEYADLCKVLTDPYGTPLTNMYAVNRKFNNYTSCLDINYDRYIQYLQNTGLNNTDRAWLYQTCREFGFYQSANDLKSSPPSFYGNIIPVDWYINQCNAVFGGGFSNASVYYHVDYTNNYYGGQNNYKGQYVILTYGTFDPWHGLGVLTNNGSNGLDYTIMMANASHCAAMGAMNANDPPSVTLAKTFIKNVMYCLLMPGHIC